MHACLDRHISEDFSGVALHFSDLLDAASGQQLAQLTATFSNLPCIASAMNTATAACWFAQVYQ